MSAADLDGFRPAPYLPGRHLQTIVPALIPPPRPGPGAESLVIEVEPGTSLRVLVDRPAQPVRGTLVLIHGLGGSADSAYLHRTARMALERGWIAVRVNLRTCGGTEALSGTLYNAGQSDDAGRVLARLADSGFPLPFALLGFSLGGNLVLRYAGRAEHRSLASAVVAVNPPIDLEACVRSLESRGNAFYHAYFTWRLCRLLRRIRRVREIPGPAANPFRIGSVRRFDSLFTAPDAGHRSAEEYYRHASAAPCLEGIQRPTLILSSQDDPFVPPEIFRGARDSSPRFLRLAQPRQGGHVGYWQSGAPGFWAGWAVLEYLEEVLAKSGISREAGNFEVPSGVL
jgi:predicted alpha/beta-fold hydrolase